MALTKLDKAAIIAIRDCMGAGKKEKVLIITDTDKREIGYALYKNALKLGHKSLFVEMPPMQNHGQEPPDYVAELMRKFEVVLCPTTKSLTHTDARRKASETGARVATFPGITEEVMIRGLNADYEKIAALSNKLKRMMDRTSEIRITSPIGTDISLSIKGRAGISSKGLFRKKGEGGNLPTGEAFSAPVEGSADGVFVVDGSMAGVGVIENEPIRIKVEKGLAVNFSGGKQAEKLRKLLEPFGGKGKNIAEIGIGTNHKARLSGNLLEDEKVLGTAHIALGNNLSMGGKVSVPIHLDGVIKKPTIYFDGKIIMKSGKFVFN